MTKIPILFEIIKERGITQKQLSNNIGASQGNISDWKKGKAAPTLDVLIRISDYLNVSVDYLLGRADNSVKPASELTDDETKLLNGYRLLEQYQKDLILHDIELLNRSNEASAKAGEAI